MWAALIAPGFLVAGTVTSGGVAAAAAAVTPAWTAYVANFDASSVTPIDIATNIAGPSITVGSHPGSVAITPNGKAATW